MTCYDQKSPSESESQAKSALCLLSLVLGLIAFGPVSDSFIKILLKSVTGATSARATTPPFEVFVRVTNTLRLEDERIGVIRAAVWVITGPLKINQ